MSMNCVIKFYEEYFAIKHKILLDLYGGIIGRGTLLLLNVKLSTNQRLRYKPEDDTHVRETDVRFIEDTGYKMVSIY